jgi:hypothetical protein
MVIFCAIAAGCTTMPPRNIDSSCAIYEEYDSWYAATKEVKEKYGVPQHVILAIIHQESRFVSDAKPPRTWILGIIPWTRKSSAYGYAQAKDETWDWYVEKSGNHGADRDDFEDAVDFIGWYVTFIHQSLKISKWDAYNQYLAYHEGRGGYERKTYLEKPWLVGVAKKVKARADKYAVQLHACRQDLEERGGWL